MLIEKNVIKTNPKVFIEKFWAIALWPKKYAGSGEKTQYHIGSCPDCKIINYPEMVRTQDINCIWR